MRTASDTNLVRLGQRPVKNTHSKISTTSSVRSRQRSRNPIKSRGLPCGLLTWPGTKPLPVTPPCRPLPFPAFDPFAFATLIDPYFSRRASITLYHKCSVPGKFFTPTKVLLPLCPTRGNRSSSPAVRQSSGSSQVRTDLSKRVDIPRRRFLGHQTSAHKCAR
jgi:hypothetical protein